MSNESTSIKYTFANGEISPGIYTRREWERWLDSIAVGENGYITPTGAFRKRPGIRFLNEALHDDKPITFVRFEFSTDQVYMLEFGDYQMRFYVDGELVLNDDNTDYILETPYSAEQARWFAHAQYRDTIFFAHWDVSLKRLVRYGHNNWVWEEHFTDETTERPLSPSWIRFIPTGNGHNGFEYLVTSYQTVSGTQYESVGGPTVLADPDNIPDPITTAPQSTIESIVNWDESWREQLGSTEGYPTIPDDINPYSVDWDQTEPLAPFPNDNTIPEPRGSINQRLFNMLKQAYPNLYYAFYHHYATASGASGSSYRYCHIIRMRQENISSVVSGFNESNHIFTYALRNSGSVSYAQYLPQWAGYATGAHSSTIFKELCKRQVNADVVVSGDGTTKTSLYNNIIDFITTYNADAYISYSNTIQWAPVAGAEGYYIYRRFYEGQDRRFFRVETITDPSITQWTEDDVRETVPELITPIESTIEFLDPDSYPSLVSLYQQRLVLGATKSKPQSIFGSRTGIYTDFTINPTDDASGYEFEMASSTANPLESILPIRTLYLLTAGGDFVSTISGAMNASNVNFNQQSYNGSSNVDPIIIGDVGLYVPINRQTLKTLKYSYASDNYDHENILFAAQHLTKNKRLVRLGFQRDPINLIWALADDGQLLSCLFVPEQSYLAWTHHITDGEVTEIETAPNTTGYDDLYLCVRRNVDGRTRQYIERFDDLRPYIDTPDATNSFFVDCGLSAQFTDEEGKPITVSTVNGLEHLEGREVAVLADFAVQKIKRVENGAITLDRPAHAVSIGLPYVCTMKTLEFELNNLPTLRDMRRAVYSAVVEVEDTRELKYLGDSGDEEELIVHLGDDSYPNPVLFNGDIDVQMNSRKNNGATMTFRSDNPVPMTINSIVVQVKHGNT